MADLSNKVIISCAITGGIHTPTMSDALPFTPDDIARQAIDAAEAGAAILHLHARDPETGRPTPDPAVFMQFLPRIKQDCDAVINITTGGGLNMTVEERLAGAADRQAGNVLAQHGLDEFRPLPARRSLQGMEVRLGGAVSPRHRRLHLPQHLPRHRAHHQTARRGARHPLRARMLRRRPPLQSRAFRRPQAWSSRRSSCR